MGMYTGLRADVVVRPEYREAIRFLHRFHEGSEQYGARAWEAVWANFPALPGVREWATVGRSSFIPFGGLACMPDDWSDAEDGEGYSRFDGSTGRWAFCCSLKNYEGEIKKFTRGVLRHIVERVSLYESLYEEDASPTPCFPTPALFRLCVERVAALEGVDYGTALRWPEYALSDRLQDAGEPELMVAAARRRPPAALGTALAALCDRLTRPGDGPTRAYGKRMSGDRFLVWLHRDASLTPTMTFVLAPDGRVGVDGVVRSNLGGGRDEHPPVVVAVVREMERLGEDLADAWELIDLSGA